MDKVTFENSERSITEEDLLHLKRIVGFKLPIDFKNHYLGINGGFPTHGYIKGDEFTFSINSFFSVKNGDSTIENLLIQYKDSGLDFGLRVPFAYDDGGNIFFINLQDDKYGYIEIGQHEFFGEPDENVFVHVCNTFSEFLEGMADDL